VSNEEASGELSEARRRALEASVAPDADIYLSYEETEALWSGNAEVETSSASVVRNISFGSSPQPLYRVMTHAPNTEGRGVPTEVPLLGIGSVVLLSARIQVPVGPAW
jgi:hypothetical protein